MSINYFNFANYALRFVLKIQNHPIRTVTLLHQDVIQEPASREVLIM